MGGNVSLSGGVCAFTCQIADALGVCVRELCPDQKRYAVPVEKNTLAKLIVVSEINGVGLDALVASILERESRITDFTIKEGADG